MDTRYGRIKTTTIRASLAASAAAVLAGGGFWYGVTAQAQAPRPEQAPAAVTASARAGLPGHDSYADVVRVVAPTVVTIRTEGRAQASPTALEDDDPLRRFFGGQGRAPQRQPQGKQRGLGSGVVVSADGYILTNHHVVNGADEVRVDFIDGRTFKAAVVGSDAPSDLAVLKVEAANLPFLRLGNSDVVQVGDVVLAVGNPLGIGQTVTMGIVSAKGRSTGLGDGNYEDFLQTDAPINQGNSGGALVDSRGELVGINSQILSTSGGNIGIGFAIPANMAEHVMTLLRKEGRVRRAQLGVTVQPITSDLAASLKLENVSGAIVSSVAPDSPAERAGVKRGDVILSLDGQAIHDSNVLRNRIAEAGPGSQAALVVNRDGSQREITVTLGEAASETASRDGGATDPDGKAAFGVAVAPLTPDTAEEAGLPRHTRGLLVREVRPESHAESAGIQVGDVIQEVNRQPVTNAEELRSAMRTSSDRPVLLLVNRSGRDLFLTASLS